VLVCLKGIKGDRHNPISPYLMKKNRLKIKIFTRMFWVRGEFDVLNILTLFLKQAKESAFLWYRLKSNANKCLSCIGITDFTLLIRIWHQKVNATCLKQYTFAERKIICNQRTF